MKEIIFFSFLDEGLGHSIGYHKEVQPWHLNLKFSCFPPNYWSILTCERFFIFLLHAKSNYLSIKLIIPILNSCLQNFESLIKYITYLLFVSFSHKGINMISKSLLVVPNYKCNQILVSMLTEPHCRLKQYPKGKFYKKYILNEWKFIKKWTQ